MPKHALTQLKNNLDSYMLHIKGNLNKDESSMITDFFQKKFNYRENKIIITKSKNPEIIVELIMFENK